MRKRIRTESRLVQSILASCAAVLMLSSCVAIPQTTPEPTSRKTSTVPSVSAAPEDPLDLLWLAYVGAYPDAERPAVELVRYISPADGAPFRVSCMHDEGFPDVSEGQDGSIASGIVPPAQNEAYAIAQYVCAVKYQIAPEYQLPFTDEQLGDLYDYYVESLIPCLDGKGYAVVDIPSRGTFVDSEYEQGWSPYQYVRDFDENEWLSVNEQCPQWPSGFYGY